MGDRVEPAIDASIVQAHAPQSVSLKSTDLRRGTDFLLDTVRIGNHRSRYDKYRRYVTLESNNIFEQLVGLFTSLLKSHWQHFRRFMESFQIPIGVDSAVYAARIYISTWFFDTYCSIREAVRVTSPLAFNEKYSQENVPYSREYDAFLSLLNASLRPTHIQYTPEDSLYIPVLTNAYNWVGTEDTLNPFGIRHFHLNHDIFYGIIQIMKERKTWKLEPLSTNTIGRPCWLFDWHENGQVCAWFPREGNYTDEDVALAYIIGVACTPKLGSRDVDDWQFPENGRLPPPADFHNLPRVTARRFYGSYEVRTVEIDEAYQLPSHILEGLYDTITETQTTRKKRKGIVISESTSGTAGALTATDPTQPSSGTTYDVPIIPSPPRFRIIDWCYHSRVVLNSEWHTRTGAYRILALN